jgi:hypothetical protein
MQQQALSIDCVTGRQPSGNQMLISAHHPSVSAPTLLLNLTPLLAVMYMCGVPAVVAESV